MLLLWLMVVVVVSMRGGMVESLPPNYEDIDMSVDQAKGEKVSMRSLYREKIRMRYLLVVG